MIRLRNINGKGWMQPSDLYEWTIEQLANGTLHGFAEEKILENLKSVEWIKDKCKTLNGLGLVRMYSSVLEAMLDGSMPPDIMSWSAMYYNFTKKGLNTNDMRFAINSSPELIDEIEETMRGRKS